MPSDIQAMLTGIHFLLTYACNYECDHCFLYCGPQAEGTFTLAQLRDALAQMRAVDAIDTVYFEGGEPFLYYPLMVEGARLARAQGCRVGLVTNAYWATSEEDARLWLEPLVALGLFDLSVSDDAFHGSEAEDSPAKIAQTAARSLGLPVDSICIEQPAQQRDAAARGQPVVGGGAMIRGRAADKLIADLPRHPADRFTECPHEDLATPGRLHLDPFGHLHLCQGLSMGSIWHKPLKAILSGYTPEEHPVVGPLLRGGPAALAREHQIPPDKDGYVDACHLCYRTRQALVDRLPAVLAPRQVYGLET